MIDDKKYVKIISSQTQESESPQSVIIREPSIASLNITPMTVSQTFVADGGIDGYSPINVSAVDSSIDPNIIAGNIKSGVNILGVVGNAEIAPEYYIKLIKDSENILKKDSKKLDFSGVVNIYDYTLAYGWISVAFPENTIIDMSDVETLNVNALYHCFHNCTGIKSVDLSSLTAVNSNYAMEYCFALCGNLTSVDLSSLTTISGSNAMDYCFYGCGFSSFSLPALTTVSGGSAMSNFFKSCENLTTMTFDSLQTITGNNAMQWCFDGCSSLTTISFPALRDMGTRTNQFSGLVNNLSDVTIHFPSNMQSVIEGLSGYPNFGGTNTTVLFDLPSTAQE